MSCWIFGKEIVLPTSSPKVWEVKGASFRMDSDIGSVSINIDDIDDDDDNDNVCNNSFEKSLGRHC